MRLKDKVTIISGGGHVLGRAYARRIDVLLNNAAIYVTQEMWMGRVEDCPLDEWDRVMEVNLKGVFMCCRGVIPVMKEQKSGKIINIASGTFLNGTSNMPHYTSSKGGVVGLTRVMARQLGDWNINVNCMTLHDRAVAGGGGRL